MAKDVSIVFKASDNLSNSVMQMKKNVKGLSRDVTDYRKIQDEAFNKKTEVKLDITKAKSALKDLKKDVERNIDGSDKKFKQQQKNLEELQEEYKRLSRVAKDAGKAEMELRNEKSKTANRATPNIGQSLAKAGLGMMVGDALMSFGNQTIGSMYGSMAGDVAGNLMGGASMGAAIGSIVPGIGTAIGAGVGTLVGAIKSVGSIIEKKDDVFRNEVQSLHSSILAENKATLQSGSNLQSQYENNLISFTTLLKSKDKAQRFVDDVKAFSDKTPFTPQGLLETSKTLMTYKFTSDEIIPFMTKVGDTAAALGMNDEDRNWIAKSLGRMNSTNRAAREFIDPMTERGVPAIDYLAESFNKSTADIYKMISKSQISGADAVRIITEGMEKDYKGGMLLQSESYQGKLSTLQGYMDGIERYKGLGYNEERKKGIQAEIDAYGGEMGDKMKDAYELIGKYQADLENQHQQAIIDAITAVQDTDEYYYAFRNGDEVKIGEMFNKARAEAETAYKNSDIFRTKLDSEKQLISDVQDAMSTNGDYVDYGVAMANDFSKGWISVMSKTLTTVPNVGTGNARLNYTKAYGNGYATGLPRVPRDGAYYLHEGEEVVPKSKVSNKSGGNSFNFDVRIEGPNNDPQSIARLVADEIVKSVESIGGVN